MPLDTSEELQSLATARKFDEIHEVVRVFTVYNQDPRLMVRVTIHRYYCETGSHYHLSYEREDEHGVWSEAEYGQVLTGSESEESTIRTAVSFIRQAHKLHRDGLD